MFAIDDRRAGVAGHNGILGSAVVRRLAQCDVLTVDRDRVDLTNQVTTRASIADARPDAVFLAGASAISKTAEDQWQRQS